IETAVPAGRLRELNDELLSVPDGFTIHPKLAKQLERRRAGLDEGGIDWGQAEELAFASLLVEGIPVRLTGQDTERGTFSHLQLAAQENIRIADCTTAAQYFHLLRRQALDASARPLIVMTPKGLLRLKQAASALDDLSEGAFRPVLGDSGVSADRVRRLVLCSGKVYFDLAGHELRAGADWIAIGRLAQLYPFPVAAAAELVRSFPQLEELVWAQEEPQNMGTWRAIRHRLEEALPEGVK